MRRLQPVGQKKEVTKIYVKLNKPTDQQPRRLTVAKYLQQWMENYCAPRLSRNTVNGYRINIDKHLIPYIGKIPLDRLQPEQIQALYGKLHGVGLSNTSILYVHATLRKALNSAVKQRTLNSNPANCVDPPSRDKFKPSILTGDGLQRLLVACEGTEVYIPVLLAVSLGLRRGEVLGLKWCDVDFLGATLEVQRTATFYKGEFCLSDTKTECSHRTLMLSDTLLSRLSAWKRQQFVSALHCKGNYNPHGMIVCRVDGTLMTSTVLNYKFKKALTRAGLPDIRFHDLRHSNATLMLRNNVPAKIVQSIFGHSKVSTTLDLYSHVITEMQEPAVAVVENLLQGSKKPLRLNI